MGLTYRLIVDYEHFCDTDKKSVRFSHNHILAGLDFALFFGGVDFYVQANYMMSVLVTYFLSLITTTVETPI